MCLRHLHAVHICVSDKAHTQVLGCVPVPVCLGQFDGCSPGINPYTRVVLACPCQCGAGAGVIRVQLKLFC